MFTFFVFMLYLWTNGTQFLIQSGLIYLVRTANNQAVFLGPRFPVEFHVLTSEFFWSTDQSILQTLDL